MDFIKKYCLQIVLGLFVLLAVFASVQSIALGEKTYVEGGKSYNRYNNYSIFKYSFIHLKEGQDLYQLYPEEHWDLYKYSPAFALFFGSMALLPDWLGLNLWNLLNALLLLAGFYLLPGFSKSKKAWMALFCLPELVTSMQNEQSNGLMAGCFILALACSENRQWFWATLLIAISVYTKLFGLVLFALFLCYPQKGKVAGYTALHFLWLALIPLLLVDVEQLKFLYQSWGELLANDHSSSIGFSVAGWLQTWFGVGDIKRYVLLLGVMLYAVPLVQFKKYKNYRFRILLLASTLLWVVIFNHKAESPTFVIAVAGVALWYFIKQQLTRLDIVLMVACILFTSLASTDVYPPFVRNNYFVPYVVKAVPCIFIWAKIWWEMMLEKRAVGRNLEVSV